MLEKTFVIIKPNAVKKHVIGAILKEYEDRGLKIVAMKFQRIQKALAEVFYEEHSEKPFFQSLISFITSGPIVVLVLEGVNVVLKNREIIGPTNPEQAPSDSLRALFGDSVEANALHGSDSVESALREIHLFFKDEEIFS